MPAPVPSVAAKEQEEFTAENAENAETEGHV